MLKKILYYVITAFIAGSLLAKEQPYKELSIIVSSCDKYSQFWDPFFQSLHSNWPELDTIHNNVPIYLLANHKSYISPRVKTINIPHEISWSDNMISALEHINTKYVLLFLDDYWLNQRVDEQRFAELYNLMEKKNAAYLQLFVDLQEANLSRQVSDVSGIAYKNKFQKYRASLQLALWETAALKQLLRTGESAWDFEMAASIRSSGYPKEFLVVKNNAPIMYLNAAHQGHMQPAALELAKAQNPNYVSTLPILNKQNWDLKLRHAKHRLQTVAALIKRNVLDTEPDSYRYIFEERD